MSLSIKASATRSSMMFKTIRLAERNIKEAQKDPMRRGMLIKNAAGAIRYLRSRLGREDDFKFTKFVLIEPQMEALSEVGISDGEFASRSQKVLETLQLVRDIVEGKA
jgi:hypothetical protein